VITLKFKSALQRTRLTNNTFLNHNFKANDLISSGEEANFFQGELPFLAPGWLRPWVPDPHNATNI